MISYYHLLQRILLGVEKNNDDAQRIAQRKSNHNDDPAEVLHTEYRLEAQKHREQQHRKYTKRAQEYWDELIKTKRGKKRGISYLKNMNPSTVSPTDENVSKNIKNLKKTNKNLNKRERNKIL